MNRFVAFVACSFCFCFAAQAAKNCPVGDGPAAMGDLEIVDVSATVSITDGVARAAWRVVMKNTGHGPARVSLDFATDALDAPLIVTGVQIAGRHDAVLAAADVAAEAFDDFTTAMENGVDEAIAGSARTAVHAAMGGNDAVVVDVAAACSQRRVVVHVEGAVQSLPKNGGAQFMVPRLTARDRITIHADDADVWAAGRSLPANGVVAVEASFVDDDDSSAPDDLLVEVRDQAPRLRATGVVRSIADTTLVQAGLDLPAPLTTTAADLRIVFVVDASVSAGDAGVQMALRLVGRVLDEAPADTRWSLITAARTPRVLVGPWRARDDRFVPTIVVDNGSDIPAAIRMATGIAEDVEGAGRVIVLSDLQLATAHEATLTSSLIPNVVDSERAVPVLHMVALPADPGEGRLAWDRLTDGAIVTDTERRGGVFIGTHEGDDDANTEFALARYLIRPTRLDDLQLFVDGAPFVDDGAGNNDVDVYGVDGESMPGAWPMILDEGRGLRLSQLLSSSSKRVELRARAWSTPIVLPVETVDAVAAAGTAINGPLRDVEDADIVAAAATGFGFVSSMTSFVDVPKWRPAQNGSGAGYASSCGCSCMGRGFGHSGIGTHCTMRVAVILKAQQILNDLATAIAATCKADVHATIEVGDLEVLSVSTTKSATKRQTGCVRELVWAARLDQLTPGDGSFEDHTVFGVDATFVPEPATDVDVDDDEGDG